MSLDHRAPYDAIGGEDVLKQLVKVFYDTMERDAAEIAELHELDEHGKVSARARHNFWRFLCLWTGGPDDYLDTQGHPRLRRRHAHFRVDEKARDQWLHCMTTALDEVGIEGEVRELLDARFKHVAHFLQNTGHHAKIRQPDD